MAPSTPVTYRPSIGAPEGASVALEAVEQLEDARVGVDALESHAMLNQPVDVCAGGVYQVDVGGTACALLAGHELGLHELAGGKLDTLGLLHGGIHGKDSLDAELAAARIGHALENDDLHARFGGFDGGREARAARAHNRDVALDDGLGFPGEGDACVGSHAGNCGSCDKVSPGNVHSPFLLVMSMEKCDSMRTLAESLNGGIGSCTLQRHGESRSLGHQPSDVPA